MNDLPLARALTAKTNALAKGLGDGNAAIYEQVTPITAELLRWWFLDEICQTRPFNFHEGQRQAILNTLVAHEVLGAASLESLYAQIAPEALAQGELLAGTADVRKDNAVRQDYPKYCLKMATGTGKTWVLQALLIWQLLNANAARAAGIVDARFTRNFLIVAPGLIVYERLLDAFCGKRAAGGRDFATSDVACYAELFIPAGARETVFGFVQGNLCAKEEIGRKTTGNGLLALTNWHLLAEGENTEDSEDAAEIETPGACLPPERVIAEALPLAPGKSAGNALDTLDRRYARGNVLDYLSDLPDLLAFNDEAHHIHSVKKEGEITEVEWQKSLSRIAARKGRRFTQVDFSATPYNDLGSGKKKRKAYFPHIIADFDLQAAMRAGLVKSLVLDKRREVGAVPLESLSFKADRDEDGNPTLSEGQRVMLRAGFTKLKRLEADFARIDPTRHPKMLVVCEDTTVAPMVAECFRDDLGLSEDEILSVDSGKKAELSEKEWEELREKLFDVDHRAQPRVIISVLMLREGFDVNNICVIVPLRSSKAQILLEQTIGRGLRLMWREAEFEESKQENRARIQKGEEPDNLIDVLSIIEHPAFQSFYDELMQEGLAGVVGETGTPPGNAAGDLITVGLRENFADYDFAIPFILCEAEENLRHQDLRPERLPPFKEMSRDELKKLLGKGDVFTSQDLQAGTLFGDYRVDGVIMRLFGYNDFLTRLTRRIGQALSSPLPKGKKAAAHLANPYLQTSLHELAGGLDDYIRETLFGPGFEPMADENWRLLLLESVLSHIVKVFSDALVKSETWQTEGETEVHCRWLSEIACLPMRESCSLPVEKCIYERLAYPARNGGLERAFIEWAQADARIAAFCKVSETRHDFVRLRYVKADGLPAFYSPDFLARNREGVVYLVETKATEQMNSPNVERKLKAAQTWCERINNLPETHRQATWHYVLLSEKVFYDWRGKQASLAELLDYARVRASAGRERQGDLLSGLSPV
jgi:type III restriction enzyme